MVEFVTLVVQMGCPAMSPFVAPIRFGHLVDPARRRIPTAEAQPKRPSNFHGHTGSLRMGVAHPKRDEAEMQMLTLEARKDGNGLDPISRWRSMINIYIYIYIHTRHVDHKIKNIYRL